MKLKVLALVVAMVFGLTALAFAAEEAATPEPAAGEATAPPVKYGTAVGDVIRPVTLSSIDGSKPVDISKLTKRSVFVLVSSMCTACRKEIQDLTANFDTLKEKVDIYAVSVDMDPSMAVTRFGKLPFPLLTDPDYKLGQACNLGSTPSTLVLDGGKIASVSTGYRAGQWSSFSGN
jgi:peroxiredoxin